MLRSVRPTSGLLAGKAWSFKFARSRSDKPEKTDQDKDAKSGANKPLSGGAYAKRSDEQGFGATHGGNQSLSKEDEDKIVHGNVPEYDTSKKTS